jgi:dTDP-4-dehydrorhamnose reductase
VPVFVDRTISPSYVVDVAHATRRLLEGQAPHGLYHCVNSGQATWRDIAERLAAELDRPARLRPVRVADVSLRAPRPRYCALSNAKLAAAGIVMPTWEDALARYIRSRTA